MSDNSDAVQNNTNSHVTLQTPNTIYASPAVRSVNLTNFLFQWFLVWWARVDLSLLLDYGLDDQGSIPGRGKTFSLRHRVQTNFGAHPVSYTMGTGGYFSECKAAEAW